MRLSQHHIQRTAIALGMGMAIAAGVAFTQVMNARNGCVRTIFTAGKAPNGQEIVYSWGCLAPQRFRQWSVMALFPAQRTDRDSDPTG